MGTVVQRRMRTRYIQSLLLLLLLLLLQKCFAACRMGTVVQRRMRMRSRSRPFTMAKEGGGPKGRRPMRLPLLDRVPLSWGRQLREKKEKEVPRMEQVFRM